jgi:amino acid transporter
MASVRRDQPPVAARLSLWDTTSMIVGIIIGVGIYETPGKIFRASSGPWEGLALWVLGGLVALVGAFCFAELASTYPRSGGEYVYLTRAYGRGMGFVFGWAQLAVIRTAGSIAGVAYIFADYWNRLFPDLGPDPILSAAAATVPIVLLTAINIVGVYFGKRTQNALTALKVLGIAGILLAGFLWGNPRAAATASAGPSSAEGVAWAMMMVLWTYAGWHEAAYVAAEVRDRRRNLPRALLLGTGIVTALYLLINLAYLAGLGFTAAQTDTVSADLVEEVLGKRSGWCMTVLVLVSALGCLNGMIFTSSRIFAELGADHALFAPLGRWHRRLGTPVCSLLLQGGFSAAFVLVVGIGWSGSGFDTLLKCTAAVFWLFFLLTGLALFVLRWHDPHVERPFPVPLYPLTPLLFCLCCAAMIYGCVYTAPVETLIGLGIVAAGIPMYFVSRRLTAGAGGPAAPVPTGPRETLLGVGPNPTRAHS